MPRFKSWLLWLGAGVGAGTVPGVVPGVLVLLVNAPMMLGMAFKMLLQTLPLLLGVSGGSGGLGYCPEVGAGLLYCAHAVCEFEAIILVFWVLKKKGPPECEGGPLPY